MYDDRGTSIILYVSVHRFIAFCNYSCRLKNKLYSTVPILFYNRLHSSKIELFKILMSKELNVFNLLRI